MKIEKTILFLLLLPAALMAQENSYLFNTYMTGQSALYQFNGNVLSNNQSQSEFIADGLASIALDKKIAMPYRHKEIKIDKTVEHFVGKYMVPLNRASYMANFPVEIMVRNNTLVIHGPGVANVHLKPESATKFFYGDGTDQQIEFEKDSDGENIKVFYTGYGVKREINKMN